MTTLGVLIEMPCRCRRWRRILNRHRSHLRLFPAAPDDLLLDKFAVVWDAHGVMRVVGGPEIPD